ncbi:uncharacterized protein LOC143901861 [Temnothorax americanus]|uniref:uncharacterized protein LOC143901861 n=1 Tax=Temnothorax americanus TaxID=1964332 RepID=UPI004068A2F5
MRNIDVKAVIRDIERTIAKATELSETPEVKIEQHDTFFKAKDGRLKLRKFKDGAAELILYKRPNVLGPKLSTYDKVELNADIVESITNILSQAMGVLGIVKKTRLLYIVGQTRIHVDKVDGLGDFIELEVVLKEDQDVEEARDIADNLVRKLFIKEDDLIAEAYVDLLNSKK